MESKQFDKGTFTSDFPQKVFEHYQGQVEKAMNTETEQSEKKESIIYNILDCCYKVEEITKASSYLLSSEPTHRNFDPCPIIDTIFDYIVKIEQFAGDMMF